MYFFGWVMCRIFAQVVFRVRTHHVRRIAQSGVLLCSNHVSFLDPLLVGSSANRVCHYMARDTLFKGILGKAFEIMQAFPISRGKSDTKAIREAMSRIKDSQAVVIFPEGTRTSDGEFQTLQDGPGMIASKASCPIQPVYIHGGVRAWPRWQKLPSPKTVAVYFGTPFHLDELGVESKRERYAAANRRINEEWISLRAEAEKKYGVWDRTIPESD